MSNRKRMDKYNVILLKNYRQKLHHRQEQSEPNNVPVFSIIAREGEIEPNIFVLEYLVKSMFLFSHLSKWQMKWLPGKDRIQSALRKPQFKAAILLGSQQPHEKAMNRCLAPAPAEVPAHSQHEPANSSCSCGERPTRQGMRTGEDNQRGTEALRPSVQEERTLANSPGGMDSCQQPGEKQLFLLMLNPVVPHGGHVNLGTEYAAE
uniref:uncharacterized protein LOC118519699 n=1 Tax=Halichoerus grypus TaxID=9711 RepID=UPI001659576C|nr:uncharacterized protein LOC118519699 [Halichoerus grypus]